MYKKKIYILVENELNELLEKFEGIPTKDYRFLLGTMYFTSNDGF